MKEYKVILQNIPFFLLDGFVHYINIQKGTETKESLLSHIDWPILNRYEKTQIRHGCDSSFDMTLFFAKPVSLEQMFWFASKIKSLSGLNHRREFMKKYSRK